jgi:hypothetical protein
MLMSHEALGMEQPGLFHSEDESIEEDVGPFLRVRHRLSTLDIWFEDDNAVTHAFEVVNNKIMAAKGQRGKRIQDYLAQVEGSGYSMDGPIDEPTNFGEGF